MPSSIKVPIGYHSHIFRTGKSEVATQRSTIVEDLNLQGWSWSHKQESLYFLSQVWELMLQMPRKEIIRGLGAIIWSW